MVRGSIVKALAAEANDGAANDGAANDRRQPFDQMALPTLDERANFYLRAVHGERDFTNEETSGARHLILGTMAAEVAAKSTTPFPEVTFHEVQFFAKTDGDRPTAPTDASITDASITHASEAIAAPDPDHEIGRLHRSKLAMRFRDFQAANKAAAESRAAASEPARWSQGVPYRQLPHLFSTRQVVTRMVVTRIAAVCALFVFAAIAISWTAGFSPTTWIASNTPSSDAPVAGQVLPRETSGGTRSGLEPSIIAEAQREVASALNAIQLQPDEIAALLKHGRELIHDGKFRLARLVLGRAAQAGNAAAALALGETYDSMLPERSTASADAPSDTEMARAWYEKAKSLGSSEAARRLAALPAPGPARESNTR
jgi:hypothetical protein